MKSLFNFLLCLFTASSLQAQAPGYAWAKKMGDVVFDYCRSVAVDASGNVYTTGYFLGSADFDPGAGTFMLSAAGDKDIFVSKLDASGNFVWARSMGSSSADEGYSIAVDGSGNVYTTGYFQGTADFDPGTGTSNLTTTGGFDVFISKLDASGNFVWAKNVGGNANDFSYSIAAAGGNVLITGYFNNTADFDPGAGTSNLSVVNGSDGYILKLDESGTFVWVKAIAGSSTEQVYAVAVDGSGNVFTTGIFSGSVDLDPGTGTSSFTTLGGFDIFVSKLDASGTFVWAKRMGGDSSEIAYSLALDGSGNIYTSGYFRGTANFDPGTGTSNLTSAGLQDAYVSKLDASGNFIWAKRMGGTGYDNAFAVAVDGPGNVYTGGAFSSTGDFDPGAGTSNLVSAGIDDIFLSKLDASGNFVWATGIGSTGDDRCYAVAADAAGNMYAGGTFRLSADFDPGAGTVNLTSAGADDAFVLKLNSGGSGVSVRQMSSPGTGLLLYPNPAGNKVVLAGKVDFQNARVRLQNVSGQIVSEWTGVNGRTFIMDLGREAPGLYIIAVTNGPGTVERLRLRKH